MIIPLVKYIILGIKKDLDAFFELAQEKGIMEFISPTKMVVEDPLTVQSLASAIKILHNFSEQDVVKSAGDLLYAMQIAERVISIKEDIDKLNEEKQLLVSEIARISPFGHFSIQDIDYIEKEGKRKCTFFCLKERKGHPLDFHPEVFYITTEYGLDYFFALSSQPFTHPGMVEMRMDSSLEDLEIRLSFVEDALNRFEKELKESVVYLPLLKKMLIEELNRKNLAVAKKSVQFPLENQLFSIEAWLPKTHQEEMKALTHSLSIHAEQISIERSDSIPTCLDNKGKEKIGEDLIKIYDVPSIRDKDPSLWVLNFFTLFFSIIVNDAGYGLLFWLIAWIIRKKYKALKGEAARMLQLLKILSYGCMVWGVLTCSYFGLSIPPDNILSKIAPLHYLAQKKADYHFLLKDEVYKHWVKEFPPLASASSGKEMIEKAVVVKKGVSTYKLREDFAGNLLLEFTIMIGIIHLSISFLRYVKRNIAGLGWVIFMIGGYLYFPSLLQATSLVHILGVVPKSTAFAWGLQAIYIGLGWACLGAFIQHGKKGLGELSHIIQIFVDVLSYIRLYALSLAAAIMASTFNQEGQAFGLLFGMLAILLGHTVNISLSLMGGIIHGLRLNFLEWYHYCFEGGGRLFKPLKKLKL